MKVRDNFSSIFRKILVGSFIETLSSPESRISSLLSGDEDAEKKQRGEW